MAFSKIKKLDKDKKRKPKSERQKLIATLDQLFREIIYMKYNKECQLAGKDSTQCSGRIECAHIISRGKYRLRWDVKNAICLCKAHHFNYTVREYLWWDIVKKEFPEQWAYLELLKRKTGSTKREDLQLMKIHLKQILTGMEK